MWRLPDYPSLFFFFLAYTFSVIWPAQLHLFLLICLFGFYLQGTEFVAEQQDLRISLTQNTQTKQQGQIWVLKNGLTFHFVLFLSQSLYGPFRNKSWFKFSWILAASFVFSCWWLRKLFENHFWNGFWLTLRYYISAEKAGADSTGIVQDVAGHSTADRRLWSSDVGCVLQRTHGTVMALSHLCILLLLD